MGIASFVRVAEWEDFQDEESPPPPEEPKIKKKLGFQKGPKSKATGRGDKDADLRHNKVRNSSSSTKQNYFTKSNFCAQTFRKIQQDLKIRNKRRQKLANGPQDPYEAGDIYIDKDRAIACGSGTI